MNDFQGLLSGDYGFKPQGKSAPMAPSRSNPGAGNPAFDFDLGGGGGAAAVKKAPYVNSTSASSVFLDDHDDLFSRTSNSARSRRNNESGNLGGLDDVFGGGSKSTADSSVNLDSVFGGQGDSGSRFSSLPVFDKPVYDDEDDVFVGASGLKSSSSAKYEDIFSSTSSPPSKKHDAFDDLLGGLGRKEPASKGLGGSERKNDKDIPDFDDLLPGFGASTVPTDRDPLESSWSKTSTSKGETKPKSYAEDPFVVLNSTSSDAPSSPGLYSDPLEQFSKLGVSGSKKYEDISATAALFEDIDALDGLGKPIPVNNREKVGSPARAGTTANGRQTSASVEARDGSSSARSPERDSEKIRAEDYHEPPSFETYSASADSPRGASDTYSFSYVNASDETTSQRHASTLYDNNPDSSEDVWLTVSEIPLFTQPTTAPPPSRPPPPRPARISKARAGSHAPPYEKRKMDNVSSFPNPAQSFQNPKPAPAAEKSSFASPIDEFEDFAKARSWDDPDGNIDVQSGDNIETHTDAAASAAAMKEAMERAEARFKHAKGVRERETAKAARVHQEREEKTVSDFQERELRERQERQQRERQQREEEERKQREEEERIQREREEREREQRRLERERIERERVRQAVERATREARDRAAADARARAEKAAVGKIQAEARERAERAAVMKAQAEARERAGRAAAEAKQRADREKAEKEAREKAAREAREKEARDKAAAAAAAASARASQQKNENDLESFFGMGSRASSAPRPRASSTDPFFDPQYPKKQSESVRTSSGSAANIRKTSSSTNIVDDLGLIFGGAPSAGAFQDVEGETEERRRARLERHQRTQERAAKALAEKNQRDLDAQNEQAERHRISETLDVEIRRWAAGKEGNLRALLSTLQYVLWPGCGWQPISLTDLITAAAVKKVYRKATLCIHPDKVQQKGATLQQKYVAEKVFDLLKEAWNKFNSEELF